MWRRQTLFNACEKNTNGIRIGSVVDRCRYNDMGNNQNGVRINTAGMATRIIMRTVAPRPARSSATHCFIESGSRRP